MNLIAFVGFAGSGKDTCGEYLACHHGFQKIAFADALKDACAAMFGWDRRLLEGDTAESRQWREMVDAWWAGRLGIPDFTPRWALRNVGTDVMRRHFHTDLWTLNVERRINRLPANVPGVVFTDARFPNEFALLRRYGSRIVRVRRGPEPAWFDTALRASAGDALASARMEFEERIHQSEWRWIGQPLDGMIENDADLPTLYQRTADWMDWSDADYATNVLGG